MSALVALNPDGWWPMPDPTLTRYLPAGDRYEEYWQSADGDLLPREPAYVCEEADRLIQALRQDTEAARALIRRDAEFQEWAQGYLDAGKWAGHDRSDAIKTELLERDAEVQALRQSIDELQKRYVNTRESLRAQLGGAERRADRAEAEVQALREELSGVKCSLLGEEAAFQALSKDYDTALATNEALTGEVRALRRALDAAQQQIAEMKARDEDAAYEARTRDWTVD